MPPPKHECQFETGLPVFMAEMKLTVGHIDKRIDEFIAREEKIDDEQFAKINRNSENIAAIRSSVAAIDKRMKNGGISAAIVKPSVSHGFLQNMALVPKKYLLFFAVGSSGVFLFVIDFAIEFLTNFRSVFEKLSSIPLLKAFGL